MEIQTQKNTKEELGCKVRSLIDELQCLSEEGAGILKKQFNQQSFATEEDTLLWLYERAGRMMSQLRAKSQGWLLHWNATESECKMQLFKIFNLMKKINERDFNEVLFALRNLSEFQQEEELSNMPIPVIQNVLFQHCKNQPEALQMRIRRVISIYSALNSTKFRKPELNVSPMDEQGNFDVADQNYHDALLFMKIRAKSSECLIDPEQASIMEILADNFSCFVNLMALYEMCIITKDEVISHIPNNVFSEHFLEKFVSILSTRETSRLKSSINIFKPSHDHDCTNYQRLSPSYIVNTLINCPPSRPNNLINKSLLCVSPTNHISRTKTPNQFQKLLWKAEDQLHIVHTMIILFKNSLNLLIEVLNNPEDTDKNILDEKIRKIFKLGLIQMIYSKATPEEKGELELVLSYKPHLLCQILKVTVENQYNKFLSATKEQLSAWTQQIGSYSKYSLNYKGFQAQMNDIKFCNLDTYFNEIKQNSLKNLMKQGKIKLSLINSFKNVIESEKCHSHNHQTIILKKQQVQQSFIPAYFLSFQNQNIQQIIRGTIQALLQQSLNEKIASLFHKLIYQILCWKQDCPFEQKQQIFIQDLFPQEISMEKQMNEVNLSSSTFKNWTISSQVFFLIRLLYTIYERILRTLQVLLPQANKALYSILVQSYSDPSSKYYSKVQDIFGYLKYKQEYAHKSQIAFGIKKLIRIFTTELGKMNKSDFSKNDSKSKEILQIMVRKSDGIVIVGLSVNKPEVNLGSQQSQQESMDKIKTV